jgi:hypothetical protein
MVIKEFAVIVIQIQTVAIIYTKQNKTKYTKKTRRHLIV